MASGMGDAFAFLKMTFLVLMLPQLRELSPDECHEVLRGPGASPIAWAFS